MKIETFSDGAPLIEPSSAAVVRRDDCVDVYIEESRNTILRSADARGKEARPLKPGPTRRAR